MKVAQILVPICLIMLLSAHGVAEQLETERGDEGSVEATGVFAESADELDFAGLFGDASACFILVEPRSGSSLRFNSERCSQRRPPCSTFKIPNSLVGLETGVIEDENTLFEWDGSPQLLESWERDHTLASAIQYSVVWYYQELARRVGEERMQEFLDRIDYGNRDISGGLTQFWLSSSLLISAEEQVLFLQRMYAGELPVDERAVRIVMEILVLEQEDDLTFSGKTGTCLLDGTRQLGWFVGQLESNGRELFFVTQIEGEGVKGYQAKKLSKLLLVNLGLWEQGEP